MAQYNIQDIPDDDSISENHSQVIRAPLLPQAVQYSIYVPQIAQPQIQTNIPQQGPPPQHVQYIGQLPQPPIQPQQVQVQHQQVVVLPDQNVDQPLIINPPPIVLKHTFISKAGLGEQKYFHIRGLCLLAFLTSCVILIMAISTEDPTFYCELTYNIYENRFKTSFYLFIVGFIYTTLITLLNYQNKMTKNHILILRGLWNLSYMFIFFGLFSSSYGVMYWSKNYHVYRQSFGDEILYSLIILVVQIGSTLIALTKERKISYQRFSIYSIPSAALLELILYNYTNLQHQFYWISFVSALLFSQYLVFLIQKVNKKGMFNLKTHETNFAHIFWFITIVFPFYESEK